MLYLVLTVISSSAIMIAMRFSQGRISGRISMLAVNYIICMLLAWGHMGFAPVVPEGAGAARTLLMGALNGVLFVMSLMLAQYNLPRNGVVLPSVFSRLGGLLVPLAVSVCVFGELPRPVQAVGALIALVSIVILNYDRDHMAAGAMTPLLGLFFLDGFVGAMSELFAEFGSPAHMEHFLFETFAVALALCLVLILRGKERPGGAEVFFGVLIGVPNFFASRFLLKALETIPAIIVYPTRSVGVIGVVALAGICLFGERLKKRQWAALGAISVAMVLLNL